MNTLLYNGTTQPRPVQHLLRAGSVSAIYDNGSLRYIRLGDQEVIRRIYFALRDEQWATMPTRITDETLTINNQSFHLSFVCGHYQGETEIIRWECELTGNEDSSIRFVINGTVLHPFSRNRAGFCLLHPITETVGQPVALTHPDGSQSDGVFPQLISPHQPFLDMAAMHWTLPGGAAATLLFEGDIFETEDQRNWSDASFKTYSTPLRLPMPVQLQPGDQIRQAVTLQVVEKNLSSPSSPSSLSSLPSYLPVLGLCHAIDQPKLKTDEATKLRKMGLNHLRMTVDFSRPDWSEWLTVGLSEAKRIHVQVVLALVFTEHFQNELNQLQQAIEWLNPTVSAVEVFQANEPATPDKLLTAVANLLKKLFAGAKLGAGSVEQFTELNRNRLSTGLLDYVVYPLNPQVHAFDDQTLIENIAAQTDTVLTARSFVGGTPVHVGPITLLPAHHTEADHRYPSLLAAGWLVGSLAALTLAGASLVTYFDTKGPKGVMEGIDPETNQGNVFPSGLVLMGLAGWQGAECIPDQTYNTLTISSLSLQKGDQKLLILANHTWDEQIVSVPDSYPVPTRSWVVDETTAPASMQSGELPPLTLLNDREVKLKPFAVAAIQTGS